MKVIQTVNEVENEGLTSLLGETVEVYCGNYIYAGKLVGVNTTCIKLENPHIVYDTGTHDSKTYLDVRSLNKKFQYVQTGFIESFGVTTKL